MHMVKIIVQEIDGKDGALFMNEDGEACLFKTGDRLTEAASARSQREL